MAVILRDW